MELSNVFFAVLLICFLPRINAEDEEDVLDFEICPSSHPYAFNFGQKCCSEQGSLIQWSETLCNGEVVNCNSSSCEEFRSCSFGKLKNSGLNVWAQAFITIKNLAASYDGMYHFQAKGGEYSYVEANRPIFQGIDEREGECMWWQRQHRHWWIGPCANIGNNAGFAYIEEDVGRPAECKTDMSKDNVCSDEIKMTWRKGGSDELIQNLVLQSHHTFQLSAGENDIDETTSYAGVNAVIQDRTRYKQSCRFVKRSGGFVCRKRNGKIESTRS